MEMGLNKGVYYYQCDLQSIFNTLVKTLKQCNIGCKIGNSCLGVFGYANDLTLLSPSLTGLKMLNTYKVYAKDYNIHIINKLKNTKSKWQSIKHVIRNTYRLYT